MPNFDQDPRLRLDYIKAAIDAASVGAQGIADRILAEVWPSGQAKPAERTAAERHADELAADPLFVADCYEGVAKVLRGAVDDADVQTLRELLQKAVTDPRRC